MNKIQGFRDRGAAKHFHGRKTILLEFQKALAESMESKGGTTFLIQGPPGVGKTALLAKCWDEAEERGWGVAEIDPEDLWNPDELRKTLGLPPQERKVGKTTGWGLDKIFNLSRKTETEINAPLDTPADILKLKTAPVLLVLDEAQHLGEDGGVPEEHRKSVRTLLDQIHNSRLGKPVILLAGGLGMTDKALEALGLSRLAEECTFDMEPLEEEEERQVIKDWLKKEGKAKGDTKEWVDAIAEETHCWPRHIHSYSTSATHVLKQSEGEMTAEGLRIVMEKGRVNRRKYDRGRTKNLAYNEFMGLAELFQHVSLEIGLTDEEIKRAIGKSGFERSLSKGVLYRKGLRYSIPIPSLRDYMVREWLVEKEHVAQEQARSKPSPEMDTEKEGSQKESENHTTDSPSPEKEEREELTTPESGKDPSGRGQDTDMGM